MTGDRNGLILFHPRTTDHLTPQKTLQIEREAEKLAQGRSLSPEPAEHHQALLLLGMSPESEVYGPQLLCLQKTDGDGDGAGGEGVWRSGVAWGHGTDGRSGIGGWGAVKGHVDGGWGPGDIGDLLMHMKPFLPQDPRHLAFRSSLCPHVPTWGP